MSSAESEGRLTPELEMAIVPRLTSIGRQKWAVVALVFAIGAGGGAWVARTDQRLEVMEKAILHISEGIIQDVLTRVNMIEDQIAAGILPVAVDKTKAMEARQAELDRRVTRIEAKLE